MRLLLLVLSVALGLGAQAFGQTLEELKNDGKNPDNVLTYGMGYSLQRYSPLREVNKMTVKRLVPVWSSALTTSGASRPNRSSMSM